MEYKKSIIILILVIFLFSIASVCASDANETAIASEDTNQIELPSNNKPTEDNLQTGEENNTLTQANDDETVSAQSDSKPLNEVEGTYEDLKTEIGNGGDKNLAKSYYRYTGGTTIEIKNSGVINGNGAVIDMAGSNIQAFRVNASDVTIKGLTIKNANFNDNGGAIYFNYYGNVANCNFTNNSAKYGGAIYFSDSGAVENCNFVDNSAKSGGAVDFEKESNINNCNFTNNTASVNGGAIWIYTGAVAYCNFTLNNASDSGGAAYFKQSGTVTNCNFVDNSAKYGGAIDFEKESNIKNCNFTNNTASENGGAIWFYAGTIANCNFTLNKADRGGATYFKVNGNVTNCNFTDNTASYGGAAYFITTCVVSNCNFTDNTASYGGAAYFITTCDVSNCNYINNSAKNGGAAYFEINSNIKNCNFTNNTASEDGGAIRFNTGTIANCNFTNNKASNNGGAFYFKEYGNVANCIFTNNKASDNGGAAYFKMGDMINCNFTNNKASNNGGAVYFFNTGVVSNCNYVNNTAENGGAAYFLSSSNIKNCNFTNNTAFEDGGAIWFNTGTIANCNFIDNTASGKEGGAIHMYSDTIENCNFTNNKATGDYSEGGAIWMYSGTVTNCNFIDNPASYWGGAIYFDENGTVTNCNFTDNQASYYGGAVFFLNNGNVTNCNFTDNKANTGSAIYFYSTSATKTVSNSVFLNNRANTESLDVIKNDNNITITFTGKNNLLNAIYSRNDAEVTFTNVTYWGANGIANTGSSPTTPSRSNKATGQNITVGVVVNGNLVLSDVMVTDDNGAIVLNINAGDNYYITACHDTDSYYTEAEKTIQNMKFYVNVTETKTTNKTVNITAKSNIYNETMPGKLQFILPNGDEINATYAGDGVWWAVHTFDDYKDYQVNASYIGLSNVTVTNATISIVKANSTVNVSDVVLTYGESKEVTVTTTGATGITAKIDNGSVSVIDNYTIPISDLNAGNYTLTVTTIPDGDHSSVTKKVNITVNKAPTEISLANVTVDLNVLDKISSGATLTPSDAGNLTYASNNESVAIIKDGNIIAVGAGQAIITVSFNGTDNYAAAEDKIITITVSLNDASVSVNNSTLDLQIDENFTIVATTNPLGLDVSFVPDDSGVYSLDDNGFVTALREGTGNILVKVGGNGVYAENSTKVTVSVSKIATKIILTNETIELKAHKSIGDLATLSPAEAGNLSYTSSDEDIVLVSEDGIIYARINGTATVTVSFAGDNKYKASENRTITVIVTLNDASVSTENDTIDLKVDDTCIINATANPSFLTVYYTSSNETVATVTDYGNLKAVGEGTAIITLTVGNGETYAINSTYVTVTVSKIPTEITVYSTSLDLFVGDETVIVANLTPAGAGNVTFTSSNDSVVSVDAQGNVVADEKGQAIITVSFAGDDKYAAAENKTITVTVSLNDASVTVDNNTLDLKVDETYKINATKHPDTILLDINYRSGNESVATVDENGIVTAVGEGIATITVEVGDGEIYAKNSTTITVTVNKQDANVNVSMPENVTVGDNSTVNVELPSDAKGDVTVKVDGEVVDTVAVTDGSADVTIPSLSAGNHTVEISYSGDGKYNSVNETKEISVSKNDTTPDITIPSDIEVGDNATVDVKLPSDAGGNVTLKVDGETVDIVLVTNGTASVKLPELNAGNHTVEIVYSGDDKYKSASKTATITVNKYSTNITAADVTATYKVNKYLVIKLTDSKGNPLANSTVTVELSTAKNYTTDENGQINVKVSNMVPKTYAAKITFRGDDRYVGSDATAKVVIKKATPKITAKAKTFKTTTKTKKYTITLKDNTGKAIKKATVYLKVGGKTYKATTNSKGKATFKITKLTKKGTFKATVTYKANKYYNKATKKVNIKVISTFKTVSKGSKDSKTVKKIQRALKNNGYYLSAYGHYLKVDGIFHIHTENAVKQFQKAKGLKVTGKVDEKTAKKLKII